MRRSHLAQLIANGARLDGGSARTDGAETAYSARQLEQIRSRTYDIKYPNLRARELVPVDNSIDPGVDVVTYGQYSMVGAAVIIANYSHRLPRADTFRKEFTAKVRSVGTAYGYSIQEIRAAAFAGLPLEQRKANAARRAFEEKLDSIARIGDSQNGLQGFLNQASASLYVVPNGVSLSPLWSSKTPDEILKDMNGIVSGVITSTKEIESPNMLLVPTAQYQYISSTPRSAVSDTTILEFFQKARPEVEVQGWWALAGAGAGGTDRMVAYVRDPDHLQLIIPQEFTQFAPQWEGLEILTNCEGRCGGVQVYYPLAMSYGDGI